MRDITRPEVWAPDAELVEVIADGSATAMTRGEGGWWRSEPLPPGTLYQFRVDGGMPAARPTEPQPARRAARAEPHRRPSAVPASR